jgi:hypothetical protein
MRETYPTDLSDAECGCIEPHLPTPRRTVGRPRSRHSLRKKILDAVFYILANVVDQEGIESPLEHAKEESFARLWHLWLDAGYRSDKKGKGSG